MLNVKGPVPIRRRACASCDGRRDRHLDLRRVADIDKADLLVDRLCCRLHLHSLTFGFGSARIDQHSNCAHVGDKLAKQLKPLATNCAGNENYSGDVASRPVETRHQAVPDRIAAGGEHDRYRRGRRLGTDRRQRVVLIITEGRRAMTSAALASHQNGFHPRQTRSQHSALRPAPPPASPYVMLPHCYLRRSGAAVEKDD